MDTLEEKEEKGHSKENAMGKDTKERDTKDTEKAKDTKEKAKESATTADNRDTCPENAQDEECQA